MAQSDLGTVDAGTIYLVSGANITSGDFVVSDADAIATATDDGPRTVQLRYSCRPRVLGSREVDESP